MSDEQAPSPVRIDVGAIESGNAARMLSHRPVVLADAATRDDRDRIVEFLATHGYVRTGRLVQSAYELVPAPEDPALLDAYRSVVQLADELATAQQKQLDASLRLKTLETEVVRLRAERLANARLLHKHQSGEEKLRHELRIALTKEPNTLSYQLGNALIRAGKSRADLMALPSRLLALRGDARRRRERANRMSSTYKQAPRVSARRDRPQFAVPASLAAGKLSQLRVAAIMDEFTTASFAPECEIHHLRPTSWKTELPAFRPELLFIESAWRGIDGLWRNKVGTDLAELSEIIEWCRAHQVPTVFWNKEDPVHFAGFANTANLFDFVFTTDFDCVHRYRQLLGHDRVYVLPFAAQPAAFNPLETYERKAALCFAGAYYARYPERQADFLAMLSELQLRWPIDIYDRNYGDPNPDFQFPEMFRHLIRGKLPFEQVDRAYKGYDFAINLNSVKQSQSMFARRVFELLASNTVTLSNFSRGIRVLLGDLVIATDDPQQHTRRLDELSATPSTLRRFRLAGLRKALSQHTYQDRLAEVVQRVFGIEPLQLLPAITVLGVGDREAVRAAFERQSYPHKTLVMLADLTGRVGDHTSELVAMFVEQDYYGPSYLLDLALATRYWHGPVGKAAHHVMAGDAVKLVGDGAQYKRTPSLQARRALLPAASFGTSVDADFEVRGDDLLAIDEFNYCRDGGSAVPAVDDLPVDPGLALDDVLAIADTIPEPVVQETQALGPDELAKLIKPGRTGKLEVTHFKGMVISSSLSVGEHAALYASPDFALSQLGFGKTARLYLDITTGLDIQLIAMFLDHKGQRIHHETLAAHTNHELEVPLDTATVRLGFRVAGPGTATVRAILLGNTSSNEPTRVLGRHDLLVLTNIYPAADELYSNAFVHRRVVDYAARGLRADVCCLRTMLSLRYHEFEGVDVVRGGKAILEGMLALRRHRAVLVHFLDEAMWSVLQPHLDELEVLVWVHGSEIQPWHRRKFDISNDTELANAKVASDARMKFWRSVLTTPHHNLKLVFVSQYFADEVQEDLGLTLPPSSYEIIHNLIDTELFTYEPKPAAQRTKILTIRPFASRKYANDLSVQAIVELSTKPFFNELEFRVIGDGKLFDETVAPLRGFRNVIIEPRFMTQPEIAALHKDYGVFLSPTRMDAQGVSRDEAMASGLVPITTEVAAIPEFVDDTCGFMAPLDDASGLAAAIETLYRDPARFERMSAAAAARVRRQSGPAQTTGREIELIRKAMK